MKKKVKVILLEDIESLGRAGQIIAVAEGYARNILFPDGKAALATPNKRAQQEKAKKKETQTKAKETAKLQKLAETLTGTELTLEARPKDGDEIYGSITTKDIASALNKQVHLKLRPSQIKLSGKITKLGSYDAEVSLSDDVVANIRVTITANAE